jgi:hypothetical protein
MPYFKIKYADGTWEVVGCVNALALIKDKELYTKEHINTRIIQLSGEQEYLAMANEAAA